MRWRLRLTLIIQAALVVLLVIAWRRDWMPLGVRGEWQWLRLADGVSPPWGWFALAAMIVAAYAVFVGLGWRALKAGSSSWAEARWLVALLGASIAVQVAIPTGAPDEYDLT